MATKVTKYGLLFLLLALKIQAQIISYKWAKGIGGFNNNDVASSVTYDASGNVYTTGYFKGTVDFDPGIGVYTITSAGNEDVFISKIDANGNFIWAKAVGGFFDDEGLSISADVSGNVFLTGFFNSTADFDPGAASFSLTSSGQRDIFILSLDPSGNFLFAKKIGSGTDDSGFSIIVDATSNCYVTGQFRSTADFDPGPGIFNLTSLGAEEIFILKLDNSGNFIWAKSMGGAGGDGGRCIQLDALGNVYTTGVFSLFSADFDPGPSAFTLLNAGQQDIYISKLDPNGNFIWAKGIGGPDFDFGLSVAVDPSGNVYSTGSYSGTVDFDPGPGVFNLTSTSNRNIHIFKLDASGNFLWAKGMGNNPGAQIGTSIAIDGSGNAYTTGAFVATVDFDPGPGIFNLSAFVAEDAFISKLDPSGNFIWAKKISGNGMDFANSIAVDPNDNIYIAGFYDGTSDFDPGPGVFNITSNGQWDIFVEKLSQCSNLSATINSQDVTICNGGNNGSATITPGSSGNYTYTWSPSGGNNSIALNLSAGIYSCSITDNCGISITKTVSISEPPPTLTLTANTSNSSICQGNSCTLTANASGGVGIINYNWIGGPTSSVSVVSPTITTVYTVNITDGNGCTKSQTVNVSVKSFSISVNSGSICSGQPYTIIASGANSYTWSTGANTSSIVISPSITSSYSVSGTDITGCINTQTVSINVISLPVINISASNIPICFGQSSILSANGAVTYSWFPGSGLSSSTGSSVIATPSITTVYTLTGFDLSMCSSQSTINVIVNPLPNISIMGKDTICKNSSTTLTVTGATNYTWSPGLGLSSITGTTVLANPLQNQIYTVVGKDLNNCIDSAAFILQVVPNPTINITGPLSICYGQSSLLNFNGANQFTVTNGSTNFNGSQVTLSPTVSTTYTVIGMNNGLCKSSTIFNLTVWSLPTVTITTSNDTACAGDEIFLQCNSISGTSISWYPSSGLNCNQCSSPMAIFENQIKYFATVTDANNCINSDSILIIPKQVCLEELLIPNVFTPNYDGVNDVFKITSSGIKYFDLSIYDRWGLKLFESDKIHYSWDGTTISGISVSSGTYFYIIRATGYSGKNFNFKGYLELIK